MRRSSSRSSAKTKSPDDGFSLQSLLQERDEMAKRQAERAKLAAVLAENIDEFVPDDNLDDAVHEKTLGKATSEKLKAALARLEADVIGKGGYRFFRRKGKERGFEKEWISNIDWLEGFEGAPNNSVC